MIASDVIERIRTSVDVVELVREYIPALKRSGKDYKSCCPFHKEKTPSFTVSSEKGMFYCFGCSVGGDVFRFLMKIEALTFAEAVKKLGDRLGITVEDERQGSTTRERSLRQDLFTVLEHAQLYYCRCLENLPEAAPVQKYLHDRGITQESIALFNLGYAPRSGVSLKEAALKKGYTLEILAKAGLTGMSVHDGRVRDHFRGRLMFPILDTQGRTVAFGGRVLDDTLPKYINSPESPVFSKSTVLYGLFQGLKDIRVKKKAIILEGYTDVILAHQYGFTHAAAPLGTSLTARHAELLKRYVDEVILVFDPDTAGKAATVRAADVLFESELFIKIAVLPDTHDPADFLVQFGTEKFRNIIDQAKGWIEFCIDVECSHYPERPLSAHDKTKIAQTILPSIARIENAIYRQEMKRLLAARIDVSEDILVQELNRYTSKTKGFGAWTSSRQPAKTAEPGMRHVVRVQEDIISLLINCPSCWDEITLDGSDFNDATCAGIYSALQADRQRHGAVDASRIMSILGEAHASRLSRLLMEQRVSKKPAEVFKELQHELKKNNMRHIRAQLEKEIHAMINNDTSQHNKDKIDRYNQLTRSLKGGG